MLLPLRAADEAGLSANGSAAQRLNMQDTPSMPARRWSVSASLRVGNPANHARELPQQPDPPFECQLELSVDQIRPYEHNPRHTENARYGEIKASIRACGVRSPLTVTRRPGETHFIVEAGGNTRLRAIQALWQETAEPQFGRLSVLFRPWRSESHVLAAHLIENEQRGSMTFWDRANGITALKRTWEAEQGRQFSVRQLEAELKRSGIAIPHTTLSYYRFATTHLRILGEAVSDLAALDVIRIQPRLNRIRRYAQVQAALAEDELYARLLDPVFHRHADGYRRNGRFEVEAVCLDCEAALALHLNIPLDQLRAALIEAGRSAAGDQPAFCSLEPASAGEMAARDPSTATAAGVPFAVQPKVDHRLLTDLALFGAGGSTVADSASLASKAVNSVYSRAGTQQPVARMQGESTAPREGRESLHRLIDALHQFARLAGVDAYVDTVGDATSGGVSLPVVRHQDSALAPQQWRVCRLIAVLCAAMREALPPGVTEVLDAGCGPDCKEAFPEVDPLPVDFAFLAWLFDPRDPVASTFRELMSAFLCWRRSGLDGVAPLTNMAPLSENGQC